MLLTLINVSICSDQRHLRQLQQQQEEFNFNFNIPPPPPPHNNNDNNNNNINANEDELRQNMEEMMPNEENLRDFDNMDPDGNLEGLQDANVEVRLAIFEILGVEGPFHLMFRNSFWLLGFCALYLFFTAMVPYMIGNMLAKLSVVYLHGLAQVVPGPVKEMYTLIVQHSTSTVPLQFLDFFYIFGGCCGECVFVVCPSHILFVCFALL